MFPHSGMCHFDTVFEKSQFCWLINILLRRKWVLWGWHDIFFQRLIVPVVGSRRKWGAEVLLLVVVLLLSLLPLQLLSSSDFSVEHLALRRSHGWGSVTSDEWIFLCLNPLLSGCLILILCFFPHLSFTLFLWTSFWPLLLAQDSGCRFNWIVLNSGSALHLLWSSRSLVNSDFLWRLAL